MLPKGLNCYATWIHNTWDDVSWTNLVDSFDAYAGNRYLEAVIPANVAVESSLSSILSAYLRKYSARKNVKSFLQDAATYSHQLNVLLPVITELNNLPKMPGHIRGKLNRLRKYRNQISHDGKTDEELTKDDTSEIICGALFGFRYIQLIKDQLLKT
jgi:hypothetical protein